MSIYQWVVFFLFIQLVHFLGTWKLLCRWSKLGGRHTRLQRNNFNENNSALRGGPFYYLFQLSI
jgi:hypothetical protein